MIDNEVAFVKSWAKQLGKIFRIDPGDTFGWLYIRLRYVQSKFNSEMGSLHTLFGLHIYSMFSRDFMARDSERYAAWRMKKVVLGLERDKDGVVINDLGAPEPNRLIHEEIWDLAVAGLTKPQASVLVRTIRDGLTLQEWADEHGSSVQNAGKHRVYAIEKLRHNLEKYSRLDRE